MKLMPIPRALSRIRWDSSSVALGPKCMVPRQILLTVMLDRPSLLYFIPVPALGCLISRHYALALQTIPMLASIFRFRLSNQRPKTLNPCVRDGFHDLGNIGVHTNLSVG